MPLLLKINPKDIHEDLANFPDNEHSFVYEHLKYYCSKFYPLPAITVGLKKNRFFVSRGHKYLHIGKELSHEHILCVLPDEYQSTLDLNPSVKVEIVNFKDFDPHFQSDRIDIFDHVYYFENTLSESQKFEFRKLIESFFCVLKYAKHLGTAFKGISPIEFGAEDKCAEFKVKLTNPSGEWTHLYRSVTMKFSEDVAKIHTFCGRLFSSTPQEGKYLVNAKCIPS
jgi:hypothetical protein